MIYLKTRMCAITTSTWISLSLRRWNSWYKAYLVIIIMLIYISWWWRLDEKDVRGQLGGSQALVQQQTGSATNRIFTIISTTSFRGESIKKNRKGSEIENNVYTDYKFPFLGIGKKLKRSHYTIASTRHYAQAGPRSHKRIHVVIRISGVCCLIVSIFNVFKRFLFQVYVFTIQFV